MYFINSSMELTLSTTQKLRDQFVQTRNQSTKICEALQTEDFVVQPVADVSPPKWHLGHTTWFFETFILQQFKSGYKAFDDNYGFVFNSYYESVGKRVVRTNRGNLSRPTVADVMDYRAHVDHAILEWLQQGDEIPEKAATLLELGLHHEQQHQELLLTDIKYILGHNPLLPPYLVHKPTLSPGSPDTSFSHFHEGLHTIGHQGEGFHFDNEKGVHQVYLHAFSLRNSVVTCGEYMDFINDGGYQNFRCWLSDGWAWVNLEKADSPMYWHKIDGAWHQYTLGGLQPIDPTVPVTHINYYEADAFARWAQMRLPSEFEWEIACRQLSPAVPARANFVEQQHYHPVAQQAGNVQLFGDVWEWTQSAYLPYPYFKTEEGAVGEYNGKFMINQMVLRGGSCATPASHIRPTYRNFFQPHLRWQFTGIRLARHI